MALFKRIYLSICFVFFIIIMYFAFITFQPIRNVSKNQVGLKKGIVTKVLPGKGGDIYIVLKNDYHRYYINNAKSIGLTPEKLKTDILQKEVTLHHIKKWTPLSTDKVFPHISKLQVNNQVLFNEIID